MEIRKVPNEQTLFLIDFQKEVENRFEKLETKLLISLRRWPPVGEVPRALREIFTYDEWDFICSWDFYLMMPDKIENTISKALLNVLSKRIPIFKHGQYYGKN